MKSALYRKGDAFYAPGFEVYADKRRLGSGAQPADQVHWHDYCEVELVIGGRGEHELNRRRYPLTENCAYLITPLDFHRVQATDGEELELYHVQFGCTVLGSEMMRRIMSAREALLGGIAVRLKGKQQSRVRGAFEELMEEFDACRWDAVTMLRACLERLCVLILREAERGGQIAASAPHAVENTLVNHAVEYIQYNFRTPITLADAARRAHLSANYFGEQFHACMGVTFNEYLRTRRLEYAYCLLTETDLSVAEIVRESGFQSPSYFSQVFRARYGASPTHIRSGQRPHAARPKEEKS